MEKICYHCFQPLEGDGPCPRCGYDAQKDEGKYPFALRPGAILNGRYIVGRVLGQGGFGITYVAQDYQTGQRLAVKEYFPSTLAGRGGDLVSVHLASAGMEEDFRFGMEQFISEARTLAQFNDLDAIVHVYSAFEENGTAYFAMEYLEGQSLGSYLRALGRTLTEQEADELLMPMMDALGEVHRQGVVHRDIAPDNIIVQPDGSTRLIDFGAARYSTGEASKSLDVVLKHGFAPPEQYMRRGRRGSFTDVYALAATYYYAVTGKVPPDAVDRMQEDTLQPPTALGAAIRKETDEVLMQALRINYAERIQTMAEFRQALEDAAKGRKFKTSAPAVTVTKPAPPQSVTGTARQTQTRPTAAQPQAAVEGKQPQAQAEAPVKKKRGWIPTVAVLAAAAIAAAIFLLPGRRTDGADAPASVPAAAEEPAAETVSAEPTAEQRYLGALAAMEAGDYESAAAELEALGPYRNAPAQLKAARYGLAEQQLGQGDYAGAAAAFEALGDYEDAPQRARAVLGSAEYLRSAELRSSFYFGTYEQDARSDNGAEPIEWIVLDRQGDRVLLLSRYILDVPVFNKQSSRIYYATSNMRKWLNGEFLQAAFTEAQRGAIPATEVDNSAAQAPHMYQLSGGDNTTDQIFLLSYAEVLRYFPDDGTRPYENEESYNRSHPAFDAVASGAAYEPTAYALSKGISFTASYYDGWWLRTPGTTQSNVIVVNGFDQLDDSYNTDGDNYGVRPALWLDLSAAVFPDPTVRQAEADYAAAEKLAADGQLREAALTFRALDNYRDARDLATGLASSTAYLRQAEVGDSFFIGHYEQDGKPGNGADPIEWIVLDRQEDKVFLLSRYVLIHMSMTEQSDQIGWEESDIRAWLNGEFWETAFTGAEQEAVLTTQVDNSRASGYARFSYGGRAATEDKLFLLSYQEAKEYFTAPGEDGEKAANGSSRSGDYTSVNILRLPGLYCEASAAGAVYLEDRSATWWLRTPGGWQSAPPHGAEGGFIGCVSYDNDMSGEASTRQQGRLCGVRPAMWLDLGVEIADPCPQQAADYAAAEKLAANGQTQEAIDAFRALGSYRDAEARADALTASPAYLRQAAPGDSVMFGRFEQDALESNGAEPIEWVVLERQGDRLLLLSQYVLENMGMTEQSEQIGWEESDVRAWLNGEFWQTAFAEAEQAAIPVTEVDNSLASGFAGFPAPYTFAGLDRPATADRIFLLSYQELKGFFQAPGEDGEATARAIIEGTPPQASLEHVMICSINGLTCEASLHASPYHGLGSRPVYWWLRTPGNWDSVDKAGFLGIGKGTYSNNNVVFGFVFSHDQTDSYGVRPALWLDLSALTD